MADFDLIQTDAQVQSILNDGQNMQGASAQTTLTTESVLLKDVNGNYHKILKSSFTEAIRDTLADLLVNNDKGTTINQIAAIANGDFGSITPANLASVLGAETFSSLKIMTLEAGAEHIESQTGENACGLWQICEISSYGSAKLFINKHGSVIDIYSDTAGGLSNVLVTKTTAWEFKITNNNSSRITLVLKKL